jgi:hypothetical protein
MFNFNKTKKLKFTENELRGIVVSSMYVLSDGLGWHIAGSEEESNPVVMASPEEIAEAVVTKAFWLPRVDNSSTFS